MARCESFSEGKIPLQTLQAFVEYGFSEAFTTYGAIGVKCWVYHGPYAAQEGGVLHGTHAKKG
jgi:small subunit ribosomal protein S3